MLVLLNVLFLHETLLAKIAAYEESNSADFIGVYTGMSSVFQFSSYKSACTWASAAILHGNLDIDEFLKFYFRAYTLHDAAFELRKIFSPNISGPQHGGNDAVLQLSIAVTEETTKRIKQDQEDCG